ncbi:serine/threonine protein kinase [Amycolatopsis suaedae]|uniref:non-specific serine/threonine protein kinase n=2 Tax=Amycolatopsis suaedae TaxID=2510978 RepID=A0A4V2ELV6_9PSEU|nr:serine/threonine protein kinase [Amycolatopsis suaedae]
MGTVWSAYDEFLHRPVAVKEVRLPPGVDESQAAELRERTLREARAIAVLSHPNVIILHDVAREDGEPFVVMELLPSHSLAALLRDNGTLDIDQAAAVADAVAAALEAAHAAGITHRDVKPGNVLVAADGRIKLTDFGIARNVSEVTLTRTGMMLGSPAYIAPEVASGGEVSHAADLWGLGATLFAAVEGAPPYDVNGDPLQTVTEVVHGEVPRPSPGPLAPIISGLMAKEPAERLSLAQVRQRLYPLLSKPRNTLFDPAMFSTPAKPPERGQPDAGATQVIPAPAAAPPAAQAPPAQSQGALAADPGPLPFGGHAPAPAAAPAPAGRGAAAGVGLALLAVLLFLAAAAGGFVLTRVVSASPLAPPDTEPAPAPTAPPLRPLVERDGDATNVRGMSGGLFTLKVPEDWVRFSTQRNTMPLLPPSTLVRFVSADGRQVAAVERFAGFGGGTGPEEYAALLRQSWPQGVLTVADSTPLTDGRNGMTLTYHTVERNPDSPDRPAARTTFAQVFTHGGSLWVVSVAVPTDQEVTARTELFDQIVPTFRTTA